MYIARNHGEQGGLGVGRKERERSKKKKKKKKEKLVPLYYEYSNQTNSHMYRMTKFLRSFPPPLPRGVLRNKALHHA